METFSVLLVICAGNSPVPGEFPAQRPAKQSFDGFFFICVWINGWEKTTVRYRAHYDVIIMVEVMSKDIMYDVYCIFGWVFMEHKNSDPRTQNMCSGLYVLNRMLWCLWIIYVEKNLLAGCSISWKILMMNKSCAWFSYDIQYVYRIYAYVFVLYCFVVVIGIDTKIEVIVVSPTTWEAHHSPRAKPEGCGELPRSLVTPQWPKSRYQFLFYHDETKLMMNKQILSI